MNKFCFVIQPISADKFTKRYDDTYKPAIKAAGLSAYRVDLDPSVKVPIEDIEEKIKKSELCFADISTDNPNVWYELGYAFAAEKDVVMVCDENRKEFPFDVRHKNIIKYKTESASDFNKLQTDITSRITAYLKDMQTTQRILETPILEGNSEFQPHELVILASILSDQWSDEDIVGLWRLNNKMEKAGYNRMALSVGVRQLQGKGLIKTGKDTDFNGEEFTFCQLTEKGTDFVLSNTELFDLKAKEKSEESKSKYDVLPF